MPREMMDDRPNRNFRLIRHRHTGSQNRHSDKVGVPQGEDLPSAIRGKRTKDPATIGRGEIDVFRVRQEDAIRPGQDRDDRPPGSSRIRGVRVVRGHHADPTVRQLDHRTHRVERQPDEQSRELSIEHSVLGEEEGFRQGGSPVASHTVRPRGGQRRIHIRDSQQPPQAWYGAPFQSAGISRAVVPLVMRRDGRGQWSNLREALENELPAHLRVSIDHAALTGRQRARLRYHRCGNGRHPAIDEERPDHGQERPTRPLSVARSQPRHDLRDVDRMRR